ncbi:MAG: Fic family protein [Candidatus Diapherotrites archaeon]|nr:Fic family protein [Candidatus Diapherotrites archaeon]
MKSKGYIRKKRNAQGFEYFELVKSVRVKGKVKQKIVKYLGGFAEASKYARKHGLKMPKSDEARLDAEIEELRKELRKKRMPKSVKERLKDELIKDWIYNSNSIEGNPLTYEQTVTYLETGIPAGRKSKRWYKEVDNHLNAIEYAFELAKKKKIEERDILTIQALLTTGTIEPEAVGKYRKGSVRVRTDPSQSFPNAAKVPSLMSNLVWFIQKNPEKLAPVEHAALAHLKLVQIHPFRDGNGRTARILTNIMLMQNGYLPVVIRKRDRPKYFKLIKRFQKKGEWQPFAHYIKKLLKKEYEFYLANT